MNAPLTRREKIALLAAVHERNRLRERQRVENERAEILATCATLHGFISEFWYVLEPARPFVTGWAIQAMCEHLEAVTAGDFKRLLMTVPPGMMKSLMLVFWTAFEWGPKGMPHIQVLATSYSQSNVLRDNLKLRRLVESEKFQALWPITLRDDQNAKGKFENTANGFSEARPFRSMTGGRADRVKIDDPHSTETAESDTERANSVRIFREGITDRLNDVTSSAIVIIMQRLHEKDVAAVALELGIGFVHLNLPMEFDPTRRCVTPIFTDPRTVAGELLFPERFPAAGLEQIKRGKGAYAWAAQYQQSATPREGGLFKRDWFKNKTIAGAPEGTRWVRHWDLAATELKATDTRGARTAGVKLGRTPDGRYIVGDCVLAAKEGLAVRRLIRAVAEADTAAVEISLPQDPGQAGKAQKRDLVAMLAGFVVRAQPETGDKVTRAEPFSIQCEAGNVFLVEAAWNSEFLDEICLFPGGARKDIVDACSGAFGRLIPTGPDLLSGLAGAECIDLSEWADPFLGGVGLPGDPNAPFDGADWGEARH